jgi:hypothetical protein
VRDWASRIVAIARALAVEKAAARCLVLAVRAIGTQVVTAVDVTDVASGQVLSGPTPVVSVSLLCAVPVFTALLEHTAAAAEVVDTERLVVLITV